MFFNHNFFFLLGNLNNRFLLSFSFLLNEVFRLFYGFNFSNNFFHDFRLAMSWFRYLNLYDFFLLLYRRLKWD